MRDFHDNDITIKTIYLSLSPIPS